MLEEISVESLWQDFTNQTHSEKAITNIELTFTEFMKDDTVKSKRFIEIQFQSGGRLKSMRVIATFYPRGYSKAAKMEDHLNLEFSYPDTVHSLFHVSSAFVVIRGAEYFRITESVSRVIVSSVFPSCVSVGFHYPVFVCQELKSYLGYVGFSYSPSKLVHFSSKSNFWQNSSVSSFDIMRDTFYKSFHSPTDLRYSGRQVFEINGAYFLKDKIENRCRFYSTIKGDPLHKLKLCFQWNMANSVDIKPIPSNADSLLIMAEKKDTYSHRTPMHSFIKRESSMRDYDSFKLWLVENPSEVHFRSIDKLWETSKSEKIQKNVWFKSAPINSLVANLSVIIAEMATVCDFAFLWSLFIKRARECFEKRIQLPGVESNTISYESCLIYQKLQLINSCIDMINSGETAFLQTDDQYEQSVEFYRKTSDIKYLTECWKTYSRRNSGDLAGFEVEFGRKPDEEMSLTFDPILQGEMALDYLEGLKPTEVFQQIVLVQFEVAYHDIEQRCFVEIPLAKQSLDSITSKIREFKSQQCSIVDLCRSIEENMLNIEIVNSALEKIPNADVVNEIFTKGYSVIHRKNEDDSVAFIAEAMNINSQLENFIVQQDYIFTGYNGSTQYMFVSKHKQGGIDRFVVATAVSE